MQFYLAPMEEVTGYVYRNVYQAMFGDVDKYFTPFIAPTQKKILKTRERKEVARENNQGMYVVPQILTNDAEQFVDTCKMLMALGYKEINFNLGCPAATVVTKARGSGFLDDLRRLNRFFDAVFSALENEKIHISVKTRIGLEYPEEFEDILKVYNCYPFHEIIIHPRLQKDFYNGKPNLEVYDAAMEQSVHPICYNGDIFTKQDYEEFTKRFPNTERVMIGRGIVADPGLIREITTGEKITDKELKEYHDSLYRGYTEALGSEKDALFKMKEVWAYLGGKFQDAERYLKKIRKAKNGEEYSLGVEKLFAECRLIKRNSYLC